MASSALRARCVHGRRTACERRGRPAPPARLVAARAVSEDEEIMDDAVAEFLRKQDLNERGLEPRKEDPSTVIGGDEVDEEQAKAYCRDVVRILRMLKENRDMDLREAKLVLQIDDPRNDEARKMGIEDSRGVSRDEMASALESVAASEVPKDRIALRYLHSEMTNWPFLETDASTAPPKSTEMRAAPADGSGSGAESAPPATSAGWREGQVKPPVGRDPLEKPTGLADMLPEWMGYGALYAVTLIPVAILATVVAILFFSSLK